jgi:hypothetical protein
MSARPNHAVADEKPGLASPQAVIDLRGLATMRREAGLDSCARLLTSAGYTRLACSASLVRSARRRQPVLSLIRSRWERTVWTLM